MTAPPMAAPPAPMMADARQTEEVWASYSDTKARNDPLAATKRRAQKALEEAEHGYPPDTPDAVVWKLPYHEYIRWEESRKWNGHMMESRMKIEFADIGLMPPVIQLALRGNNQAELVHIQLPNPCGEWFPVRKWRIQNFSQESQPGSGMMIHMIVEFIEVMTMDDLSPMHFARYNLRAPMQHPNLLMGRP